VAAGALQVGVRVPGSEPRWATRAGGPRTGLPAGKARGAGCLVGKSCVLACSGVEGRRGSALAPLWGGGPRQAAPCPRAGSTPSTSASS
jgi:hypothetical protein